MYRVVNAITGRTYIGQTTQTLAARWAGHRRRPPPKMAADLRQYGPQAFTITAIQTVSTQAEATQVEELAILEHKTNDPRPTYNTARGPPARDARYAYFRRRRLS